MPSNSYERVNKKFGVPWPSPKGKSKMNGQLLRFYNLTLEDYEGMIWLQDNRCAMCDKDFDEMGHKFAPAVDHDHNCCPDRKTCGKCVRAIVCGPCNRALGFYEKVQPSAERYLIQYA